MGSIGIIFVEKEMDYEIMHKLQVVNKVIIQNKYLLPRIDDLFYQL